MITSGALAFFLDPVLDSGIRQLSHGKTPANNRLPDMAEGYASAGTADRKEAGMAQSKRGSGSSSKRRTTSPKTTAKKRSSPSRSKSSGDSAQPRSARSRATPKAQPPASAPGDAAANAIAARAAAAAGARAAGRAVVTAVEQAKTPVIVGGTAAAALVGGLLIRRHSRDSAVRRIPLPIRDGKLDLAAIASAARKAGEFGQQLGDIGNAIERAQKHKN